MREAAQITKRRLPEEVELEEKRAELAALEAELADSELELATLKVNVSLFERRYLSVVARRYAELDELLARIAEAEAKEGPSDTGLWERAQTARSRAADTAAAAASDDQEETLQAFKPSEDLRSLFREAAKAMHPDLARNDDDRKRREQAMKEANDAYAAGDSTRLREILDRWQASPESVAGEGTAVELVRAIRKIAQVHRRLAEIRKELEALTASDPGMLFFQSQQAQAEGRDLLKELAGQVELRIAVAKRRLEQQSAVSDHG